MDNKNMPFMTALDQMISDDSMQALKASIPYISPSGQQFLSIFVKFLEFQKTIQLFSNHHGTMHMASADDPQASPVEILQDIRQYTSGTVQEKIDTILNALQTIQIFQMYQEMEEN